MRIQWDSALVGATARALDRRFGGARIRAWHLDPVQRRFALFLREAVVVWDLHPERLGMHVLDPEDPPPEARPLPAKLTRAWSPPDDRVVVLETRRIRGRPPLGQIVLELLPNRENAVVCAGGDATVQATLRTREGDPPLRRGFPYSLPRPSTRQGIHDDPGDPVWRGITSLDRDDARRALLRQVAWTSPLSADALLRDDGRELLARIRRAARGDSSGDEPSAAAVILGRWGPQPYPVALPERTVEEARDVLDAFQKVAAGDGEGPPGEILLPGALVEALEDAVGRAGSRAERRQEERDTLDDPARLQGWGDLLLARFGQVPAGVESVTLEGFDGTPVRIPLDPAEGPDGNARRFYDRAGRLRRARKELPARIRAAQDELRRLEDLRERVRRGEADRSELEAVVSTDRSGRPSDGPTLPYRRFRSSGGLEIRVGRGAARNDDLTFHHARPGDIWLHARHTAGAHVILRWDGEDAPPARDLEEAAVLAALHSRARTSGSVPVDWTRRKYVRKPRKAPPGAVVPDRVGTVFVTPDEALAERLRDD